jgi:hypothetical protein
MVRPAALREKIDFHARRPPARRRAENSRIGVKSAASAVARGDGGRRGLAEAYRNGARFDGWREHSIFCAVQRAFVDPVCSGWPKLCRNSPRTTASLGNSSIPAPP